MEALSEWEGLFLEVNMEKYLGLSHVYGDIDCIKLVQLYYSNELGIDFNIPTYPCSQQWMRVFTIEHFEKEISGIAKKIKLTDAQNFDLLVFKHNKSIIHFGMFLMPNKMLHIEEGKFSRIEILSDTWRRLLFGVYRHNDLV